jgi:hypothetical protein
MATSPQELQELRLLPAKSPFMTRFPGLAFKKLTGRKVKIRIIASKGKKSHFFFISFPQS